MPSGACLCGRFTVKLSDKKPEWKTVCHCFDCRKTTGSVFSTNLLVDADEIVATPSEGLSEYTTATDSGGKMKLVFCPTCSTVLWREGTRFEGKRAVMEGIFDHEIADTPQIEFYSQRRVNWVPVLENAQQY